MNKRAFLTALFILEVILFLMIGYSLIEILGYENLYSVNIIQILFLTAFTAVIIRITTAENVEIHRDPEADMKVVQDMAKQMLKTMNEHIQEPCTVMGFKETAVTYEIEWLINEGDFLKAYQEVAIIPFEKVHELEYWQEITRIIIRNNRVRRNPEKTPQQEKQQHTPIRQQNGQARKRSRTRSKSPN